MKVSRQNLTESYNTTVDWVNDFQRGITKESDYLDNLKNILNKRKDFSTIEEKMADIRTRAGFDLVKNLKSEDLNIKEAGCCASCDGGEGSCGSCSCGNMGCKSCRSRVVTKVMNLLEHLRQRNEHFSKNLDDTKGIENIISYCKSSPENLGFEQIQAVIPLNELKTIISDHLGLSKKFDEELVPYIPEECDSSDEADDAEYFRHALT